MDTGILEIGHLVEMQRELTIIVSTDLALEAMLKKFMQAIHARLSLVSIHIYNTLDHTLTSQSVTLEVVLSSALLGCVPDNPDKHPHQNNRIISVIRDMEVNHGNEHKDIRIKGLAYVVYPINNFGYVILTGASDKLPEIILEAMTPIMYCLSLSCKSCLQHNKLLFETESRVLAEKAYELLSTRDALTNVLNRHALEYRLYNEMQKLNDTNALISINLDQFRNINNSLSQRFGDCVLIRVVTKLKSLLKQGDELFRIGGNEFVVLACELGNDTDAARQHITRFVIKIRDFLSEPMTIDGETVQVTSSIGIKLFSEKDSDSNDTVTQFTKILSQADYAMHNVKASGGDGFEFYSSEIKEAVKKCLTIETELANAIDNDELYVVYQPLVDKNGQIIAAESLLRWNSSLLGDVSPEVFIPVAEKTKLIINIGDWTLRSACILIKKIQLEGQVGIRYISVNISPEQIKHPDFVNRTKEIISHCGINPGMIRLEVTENIVIDKPEDVIRKIKDLNRFGVFFLLDDFGTGYSSLAYLQYLPIETLKIDKSFITDINSKSESNKAIVDAVISMSDIMHINCIAEGVETLGDVEYCLKKNIYAMQGYFFSKPVIQEEFIKMLIENNFKLKMESLDNSKADKKPVCLSLARSKIVNGK